MHFKLGSRLGYSVTQDTPFVFNVEAQTTEVQTIAQENLVLTPRLDIERWRMPESGNRYFRVIAPPGKLTVKYSAKVDLSPTLEAPEEIEEISPASLPLPTFTQLRPSRYCQSDKLERFARGALNVSIRSRAEAFPPGGFEARLQLVDGIAGEYGRTNFMLPIAAAVAGRRSSVKSSSFIARRNTETVAVTGGEMRLTYEPALRSDLTDRHREDISRF